MNYRDMYNTRPRNTRATPQTEPIPGTVKNNAGGYAFKVNKWTQLDRFLILGSMGGTYYVNQKTLTARNADSARKCIAENGLLVVRRAEEISVSGRAPSNDPALFVLAMCASFGDKETRRAAMQALPGVARIGTHRFHFVDYVTGFRGWGRLLRRGIASIFEQMPLDKLVYQVVKYQQRDGWSNRDLLRLSHPHTDDPVRNAVFHWVTHGWDGIGDDPHPSEVLNFIWAFERAKRATTTKEIIGLIEKYNLTREMIPTKFLNSIGVWAALLRKMPLHALIRNLGKMTSIGLLSGLSKNVGPVTDKITNDAYLARSRMHPLSVLVALKIYAQGHGLRGKLAWVPNQRIVDALDAAFYLSFGTVEPSGKSILLAIDTSASMGWASVAGMPITPYEAAGAMALVTANVEKNYFITHFSTTLAPLAISPRMRLPDAINVIRKARHGGTDCSLPMIYARHNNLDVNLFSVYTDNETWAGRQHPVEALKEYRSRFNRQARLATIGMTSNGFTIADPEDAGMLDVVGFNTTTPNLLSGFAQGKF